MKKIIFIILVSTLAANMLYSQPKDTIYLASPRIIGAQFCMDLMVNVPAGRSWRVGSSNIRIDFYSVPTGKLTCHADGTVLNALSCLNSGNYSAMTTTCINGGTAISLNISRLATCCTLTTGIYRIGTLRWDTTGPGILTSSSTICDTIRYTSVVQDSIKALTYGCNLDTCWMRRNLGAPPQCQIIITGVEGNISNIPTVFKLYDNYPNPFNPVTTIKYDVPKNSFVKLMIYDILGQEVATLVNEKKEAGRYEIKWDGISFASGTYFCKMETDAYTEIKKMILIK